MSDVNPIFKKLERTISPQRLASYQQQGESHSAALSKYLWNIALCDGLYPLVSLIEVSYRNALHSAIADKAGSEWINSEIKMLYATELEKIKEAKATLTKRNKALTEPFLISELSFGFWNSLLDVRYDRMWHGIIAKVLPHMPRTIRTRSEISSRMSRVRNLRNQASHHHSIWHWGDLKDQHTEIYTLLGWICDSAVALAKKIDRFGAIHDGGHEQFHEAAKELLK